MQKLIERRWEADPSCLTLSSSSAEAYLKIERKEKRGGGFVWDRGEEHSFFGDQIMPHHIVSIQWEMISPSFS